MRGLALVLSASIMISGCLSQSSSGTDQESGAEMEGMPVGEVGPVVETTKEHPFGWFASVGIPASEYDAQFLGTNNAAEIDVPAGASALRVETTWDCLSVDCSLHLQLYDADGNSASHTLSTSPATLEVASPAAGGWLVAAHSAVGGAEFRGVFVSTVVTGGSAEGDEHAGH